MFERSARCGGALETIRRDGFVIETGADSFLSEKPAAAKLARRLGLGIELIPTRETYRKTYVVRAGRLVEIPAGFSLLAPAHLGPVFRSSLFSPLGKMRIALEPFIAARTSNDDESLESFVTRRLGHEVLERVAQALAGGIYTADPKRLSMAATMPRFVEMERRHGSVIKGMRAAENARASKSAEASGARWSLFQSFKNGMATLPEALAARLGASIRKGAEVVDDVSKWGRVEARTRRRRFYPCGRRDLRGASVRGGAHRGDDRAGGCEDARRDQLCVGGDGEFDLSRQRFRRAAARLRLRRAGNRASTNNRGQLFQLQVRRTRSCRRNPRARIRRRRDEPRDDEPYR